jgi:hypothetical protein
VLSQSNFPVRDAIEILSRLRVSAGLLVPTATGLDKSIMDAHSSLRAYLRQEGVHDFAVQAKGPEAKRVIPAYVVTPSRVAQTTLSLYRPMTKSGDPRIWISRLKTHARPNDLLALVAHNGRVYILNMSRTEVRQSLADSQSPFRQALVDHESTPAALQELLELLAGIARQGFVASLRGGPTGVGFTLETLLGIKANSSRSPDFKGIEVKAHRLGKNGKIARTRTTLLSQIPDWKSSHFVTARELLNEFGYRRPDDDRLQLYCTCAESPNPQGLYLDHEEETATLHARAMLAGEDSPQDVVLWKLAALHEHLAMKHQQTAWVGAEVQSDHSGEEAFHYRRLSVTSRPRIERFGPLVETGDITMDFTLSEREGGRVRDHGYLFKIRPESAHLLFDEPIEFAYQEKAGRFVELSN